MAAKKATVKPTGKSVVKPTEAAVKVEAPKTESVKAENKAAEPVKAEEKKETEKKAPAKRAAKAELTTELYVQFSGKSISQEDLLKTAKDVWKFDLKQKVGDLASVELYVKPEEGKVYYVMNKDFTGSFDI